MTREELDETFLKYRDTMLRVAKRRGLEREDAEDVTTETFIVACGREEYKNVPAAFVRTWWCYQVRDEIRKLKNNIEQEQVALTGLSEDPTSQRECRDLSSLEALQVLQEQWEQYDRFKQSRIRKQWEDEGVPILPCMKRKGSHFSSHS